MAAVLGVAVLVSGCGTVSINSASGPVSPPPGFVALYNGRDLDGWRGGKTFDHRALLEMPEAKRQAQIDEWTADMKAHWTAEGPELVNDGNGAYATTVKDYGDFELMVDYKTVPAADSGIYLRGVPQVQIWDSTDTNKFKLGAASGTTIPTVPARIPWCWPTGPSVSGIAFVSSWSVQRSACG